VLWRGHESGNLRAEMTALSAIASATSLARQENQDPAYAEAAGHSPSPTARATTLTATLFSGGRAALAHTGNSRASPLHSGRLRPIIEDHTIRKCRHRRRLARAGACPAPRRQTAPSGRNRPAGPAGRWPLPAVLRRTRPCRRRPTTLLCTHFARCIRRRVGQLAALAGSRASESRLTLTAGQGPACGVSRLPVPLTAEVRCPQISRDNRYRERPGGASAAAFVPDAPERIGVPSP